MTTQQVDAIEDQGDAAQVDRSGEIEQAVQQEDEPAAVYEEVVTTPLAIRLEAKAREMKAFFNLAMSFAKTTMVREQYRLEYRRNEAGEMEIVSMQPAYDLAAAMMWGSKIGIEPEDAGLRVFSVHGLPSIESKDMIALIRKEIDRKIDRGRTVPWSEGGDGIWEVEATQERVVWASRRDGQTVEAEWTWERAERAGYVQSSRGKGTKGMYDKLPIEMLRWKASAEVSRIQWSDVLRGMQYSAEELRMEVVAQQVKVEPKKGGSLLAEKAAARAEKKQQEATSRAALREGNSTAPVTPGMEFLSGDAQPEPEPVPASAPAQHQEHAAPVEDVTPPPPDPHDDVVYASNKELQTVRSAYKRERLSGSEMLEHITQLLELPETLDNINNLTSAQAKRIAEELA